VNLSPDDIPPPAAFYQPPRLRRGLRLPVVGATLAAALLASAWVDPGLAAALAMGVAVDADHVRDWLR
jgi:hypothetical protein